MKNSRKVNYESRLRRKRRKIKTSLRKEINIVTPTIKGASISIDMVHVYSCRKDLGSIIDNDPQPFIGVT